MRRYVIAAVLAVVIAGPGVPALAYHWLLPPSAISGTVTNAAGEPLANICVAAVGANGYGGGAWTDASGTYRFDVDSQSSYLVAFSECNWPRRYLAEWYDDQRDYRDADPVNVGLGTETAGIDAVLAEGGTITGTVTDAGGPVQGVCVDAFNPDGTFSDVGFTDASGHYQITALVTNTYRVQFFDCTNESHLPQWYFGQDSFEAADPVDVTEGATTSGVGVILTSKPAPSPVDLAITSLVVENVPLQTDSAQVGHTGWQRRIRVGVSNVSDGTPDSAFLEVQACPKTRGSCRVVGNAAVEISPGSTQQLTFHWNGLGSFGDVEVSAELYVPDDTNDSNNHASVDHYVILGGTGIGVGVGT